jgi:hypothetical protein
MASKMKDAVILLLIMIMEIGESRIELEPSKT